ncbi:AlpA family phage regulatory protein [Variovorax humicola]|uniref:AlpA family phage regulatory protein n=1 Tax=Variovorax humicola TaxID=1769758 RepID=A0ABU8VUE5_9BURK
MKRPRTTDAQPVFNIRPLYLARDHAAAYLALSVGTLDNLVARGDAPKPRKLSQGRVGWLVDDLDAWGRARPESDILPPVNSGLGRAGKPL